MTSNIFLNDFLDKIDPDKTLNRDKVLADLASVSITKSVLQAISSLSEKEKELVKESVKNGKSSIEEILNIFNQNGKRDYLNNLISETAKVTVDEYVKAQLNSLTSTTKKEVISSFPQLKGIS